ncbi:Uncharacterised protein [uncultured archaeon]|nr:Uncharacterised protein [uncultured archaeon]
MAGAIFTAPSDSQKHTHEAGLNGPTTQTSVAVRVLIAYINRLLGLPVPKSDEDLPEFYRLDPGLCLVRDSKERDAYYVTMPADCSCPARGLNPAEPCWHITRFFSIEEVEATEKVEI